jgi:hypothetical protein
LIDPVKQTPELRKHLLLRNKYNVLADEATMHEDEDGDGAYPRKLGDK